MGVLSNDLLHITLTGNTAVFLSALLFTLHNVDAVYLDTSEFSFSSFALCD